MLVPDVFGKIDGLGVTHCSYVMCYMGDWAVIEPQKSWPDKFYPVAVKAGSSDTDWKLRSM